MLDPVEKQASKSHSIALAALPKSLGSSHVSQTMLFAFAVSVTDSPSQISILFSRISTSKSSQLESSKLLILYANDKASFLI